LLSGPARLSFDVMTRSHLTPFILIVLVAVGGLRDGHAASNQPTGTAQCYAATLEQTIVAITNAFESGRYHGMLFCPSAEQFDIAKKRWTRKPATNQWELISDGLAWGINIFVPWNKQMLPYHAQFLIHTEQLATNQCKVTVTTILASIPHGKELGMHLQWALHYKDIPPVLAEETNVLSRIEMQLQSIQTGHFELLPATPDVTEYRRQPIKIDLTLHPEAKGELVHAIQAETNAALKAELLRMLMAATNAAAK
jgi:hypothetical protein